MNVMNLGLISGVFIAACLYLVMDELISPPRETVKERLTFLRTGKFREKESVSYRFLAPVRNRLMVAGRALAARLSVESVQNTLVWAGYSKWTPELYLAVRVGATIGGFLLGGAVGASVGGAVAGLVGGPVGAVLGWFAPEQFMKKKAQARKENILSKLPATLDLLTISAEAGLPLLGAMRKVCEKLPGTLSEELKQALFEMEAGKSLEEAMRGVSYRCGTEAVSQFVGAVLQGKKYGVEMANVFRAQSDMIRTKRRQEAEEQAHKAPVKMIVPLILFILPAIMIVLLAPAMLKMKESGM